MKGEGDDMMLWSRMFISQVLNTVDTQVSVEFYNCVKQVSISSTLIEFILVSDKYSNKILEILPQFEIDDIVFNFETPHSF